MNPWRKPVASLAFILISALFIAILPLSTLAAPQGAAGTPIFLPLVLKDGFQTATPTSTATSTTTATPTSTATATPTPTATGTPITATIPITVGLNGLTVFAPVSVTIHVGDTVHWVWDSSFHTVTSGTAPTADNQFCSPDNADCPGGHTSNAGATYDHQFLAPGTYPYFCEIHYSFGMTGTVVVIP